MLRQVVAGRLVLLVAGAPEEGPGAGEVLRHAVALDVEQPQAVAGLLVGALRLSTSLLSALHWYEHAVLLEITVSQVFPASRTWHSLLLQALSGIPDVTAGDSVWWHCDMIHSVAPVTGQQGWGNVMYIPAAPWCPRNETYAGLVGDAFLAGRSPSDFPDENYEQAWPNRSHYSDLNDIGRRGLGLD